MPEREGRGKWQIQRTRSGLLSRGRPRLILATILFSRWRQDVFSAKNVMFMVSCARSYPYSLTEREAVGQGRPGEVFHVEQKSRKSWKINKQIAI